jgi:hypothetical protein
MYIHIHIYITIKQFRATRLENFHERRNNTQEDLSDIAFPVDKINIFFECSQFIEPTKCTLLPVYE